jgi:hypothetical protein
MALIPISEKRTTFQEAIEALQKRFPDFPNRSTAIGGQIFGLDCKARSPIARFHFDAQRR